MARLSCTALGREAGTSEVSLQMHAPAGCVPYIISMPLPASHVSWQGMMSSSAIAMCRLSRRALYPMPFAGDSHRSVLASTSNPGAGAERCKSQLALLP